MKPSLAKSSIVSIFVGLCLNLIFLFPQMTWAKPVLKSSLSELPFYIGNWVNSSPTLDPNAPSHIKFQLGTITFSIAECFGDDTQCVPHFYRVDEGNSLYIGEKKVGDLFPYRAVIQNSNHQVSEFFSIQRISDKNIQITFLYSNLDGESQFYQQEFSPYE